MMPTVVSICFELQQKMSHNHCLTIMKIYVYCHMTSKKNQYFLLALDLTWITDKCYSVLVSQNDIFRRLEFLEQANLLFMMSVMQCFAIETGLVNQVTRVSCSAKKKCYEWEDLIIKEFVGSCVWLTAAQCYHWELQLLYLLLWYEELHNLDKSPKLTRV